ncbi:lipid-binding SYLF domain-containing protein [Endozoicomonadaceae bacterium StTr2]
MPCLLYRCLFTAFLSVVFFFSCLTFTAHAATSRADQELAISHTLHRLYRDYPAAEILGDKAAALLVFPKVVKGGMVTGGDSGEGGLLMSHQIRAWYKTSAKSIGLKAGAGVLSRSYVIMFMDEEALNRFLSQDKWSIGKELSVTMAAIESGGRISSETGSKSVIGFVMDSKNVLAGSSLDGNKITLIEKSQ